jgi:hypothetical protein
MAKVRTDSWAAGLSEEQSWALYSKARRCQWQEAAAWAVKEFGLEKGPSRTAFYAWMTAMREEEHEHRMGQAAIAAAEAAALGGRCTKDEALIQAFKALATDVALTTGDAKSASAFVNSAMAIKDRLQKEQELALKSAAQSTKDEQLKLAREKFEAAEKRLKAVQDAVKTAKATGGGLSEETLKKIEEAAGLL